MKVKDCTKCVGCPMRAIRPDAELIPPRQGSGLRLAIGGSPDEHAEQAREPFYAGGSNWLRGSLGTDKKRRGGFYWKAGVKDGDVTYANTISCRPPGDEYPGSPGSRSYISKADGERAVAHCYQQHLLPVLQARPWDRIDIFGDEALRVLTGRTEGVDKWRGSPMAVQAIGEKLIAIPTLHPDAIGGQQELLPVIINDLRKSLTTPPEHYNLQPTLEDVHKFTATEFVFDIETPAYRELGDQAPITIVGLCDRPYHVMVVPFTGAYKAGLKRIFANAKNVITQNGISFDLPRMRRDGIGISDGCRETDIMLLQHLRFPNLPHDLEFIGSCFSNKPAWKHDKGDFNLYCARDCDVTMQAYRQLWPMIQQEELEQLYNYVQVPLAKICAEMKALGVKQDPERLKEVRDKFVAEIAALAPQLPEELRSRHVTVKRRVLAPPGTLGKSGKPVKYTHVEEQELVKPYRSGPAKQKYLYEVRGLPTQFHPKSKEVTIDKTALDKLSSYCRKNDLAEDLATLKTLKLLSKYETLVNGFLKDDGFHRAKVIHPSYNVQGTSTGRLSSSDPNFQNQPEKARYMYVPRHAGWEWASLDFSGIENRIMALNARDTWRLEQMAKGISEHKAACSMFFDIPYADVQKDNDPEAPYNKAKHIVHGTDRGMGAKKINTMFGIEFGEAKRLQDIWKQQIHPTVQYQKFIADKAERDGILCNPFGRKAWFYTQKTYTESISFEPQSTAADVIFRCMIALYHERIGWPLEKVLKVVQHVEPLPRPANMLISVHDSLEFEYPREMRDEVLGAVYRTMTQPWPEIAGYQFPVSVAVGPSWGEVEPIEFSVT